MTDEKTVMVQFMGRVYVGNPRYEEYENSTTNPQDPNAEVLVEVENVYEFSPITTLMPDQKTGALGVLSTFGSYKVGTLISIPDDALIAELANDSPMYREYVKVTTGVRIAAPGDVPNPPSGGHHKRDRFQA